MPMTLCYIRISRRPISAMLQPFPVAYILALGMLAPDPSYTALRRLLLCPSRPAHQHEFPDTFSTSLNIHLYATRSGPPLTLLHAPSKRHVWMRRAPPKGRTPGPPQGLPHNTQTHKMLRPIPYVKKYTQYSIYMNETPISCPPPIVMTHRAPRGR